MGVPSIYRKNTEGALVNYSGTDIATNTGYITLYCISDGTTHTMTPREIAGGEMTTSYTSASTDLTLAINRTYNLTFPVHQVLNGYAQLTYSLSHSSGTGNPNTRVDLILSVNNTEIARASGALLVVTGSVPSPQATVRATTTCNISSNAIIKKGDILKANILVYYSATVGRTLTLYEDGEGRDFASGASVILAPTSYYSTNFRQATTLKLDVPLKIQV